MNPKITELYKIFISKIVFINNGLWRQSDGTGHLSLYGGISPDHHSRIVQHPEDTGVVRQRPRKDVPRTARRRFRIRRGREPREMGFYSHNQGRHCGRTKKSWTSNVQRITSIIAHVQSGYPFPNLGNTNVGVSI